MLLLDKIQQEDVYKFISASEHLIIRACGQVGICLETNKKYRNVGESEHYTFNIHKDLWKKLT